MVCSNQLVRTLGLSEIKKQRQRQAQQQRKRNLTNHDDTTRAKLERREERREEENSEEGRSLESRTRRGWRGRVGWAECIFERRGKASTNEVSDHGSKG